MVQLNNLKYCSETTNQHRISIKFEKFLEEINHVCIAEGAKRPPFSDELCINLDKIEGSLAQRDKRNARKTMDISFGIASGKQKRILLCELRFNYRNVNNLKKADLDSKIINSRNLLGHDPVIYQPYIFIFKTRLKNQAYSVLRRLYSNKKTITAMDLNELRNKYFN